ncbi:MAG TPA: ABC transporter substrate-binding protein [Opitutaceae bacterium]|nr:ABC transporter substrate-binding protein [Opitutaceae bacterium]
MKIPSFVRVRIGVCAALALACSTLPALADEVVKLGLNFPKTGPYEAQGADQLRAAQLAVEEINAAGGILGRQVALALRDSQSSVPVTKVNVLELIVKEQVKMVFGGAASSVAVEAGRICEGKGVPFFGTLTYSTTTTCEDGHRHVFRECYDSWAAAKVLSSYMQEHFAGKKFAYVTANYNWGISTEAAFRKFTGTEDRKAHPGVMTPFPVATEDDFRKAIAEAAATHPDVLIVVEFGRDMVGALRQAALQGVKATTPIIVPNLTLTMAEAAGPKIMEGVIGAVPWDWSVPYKYDYAGGKAFVEAYAKKYNRYPCTAGASAYTIVYEYKDAVERAKTFDAPAVIKALEGHRYTRLKDEQEWRAFDHQSVQSVYAVRCKPEAVVLQDKFKLDYFEIIGTAKGDDAFRTKDEWSARRIAASQPVALEKLAGE